MRRIRILAVFAALLAAAPARAATPVARGAGSAPWLVVDPAGTAHMVFRSTGDDGIVYCRLPRGRGRATSAPRCRSRRLRSRRAKS